MNVLEYTCANMIHIVVRKLFQVYVGKGPNTTDGRVSETQITKQETISPIDQQNKLDATQ
jgi:hypothetical protein